MKKNYKARAKQLREKAISMIEELRTERGWTQKQLAAELDITTKTIQNYKGGVNLPDLPAIIALCEVSSIRIDDLLNENCTLQDAELYKLITSLSPSKKAILISLIRAFEKSE